MDKIISRITEEDIQDVAMNEIGRELAPDEMESVRHLYENDERWYETAVLAIELAVQKNG
jgi:hypothetical protein